MKRTMILVGARPNLMKAAAVLEAMKEDARFDTRLVHTGQHYDDEMSKIFFQELGLPQPDVYLGVGAYSPLQQIGRILLALETFLLEWQPELVVVVGDVNSTLAGALAANKLSIPLAHVEAGLRSFDRSMPEELNRILTDQLADFLFTPSRDADMNLQREGIPPERIYFVGNVMVDTLLRFCALAQQRQPWQEYGFEPKSYAVLTLHRPSNVDDPALLGQMVELLEGLSERLPVIFPLHPRTRKRLAETGLMERLEGLKRVMITPPLGYLAFIGLMSEARVVLTDSGGIQEETTVLGVPCLTLRENTERPITIAAGTNRLAGTVPATILSVLDEVLRATGASKAAIPELWDGQAARRIVAVLAKC